MLLNRSCSGGSRQLELRPGGRDAHATVPRVVMVAMVAMLEVPGEPHGLPCYGSRDAINAIRSTMSASVRFASTGIISADMAPLRVPSFMSYICRAR